MYAVGEKVAARVLIHADGGDVEPGTAGFVVGHRGTMAVVRFGPGLHAVLPAEALTRARPGKGETRGS